MVTRTPSRPPTARCNARPPALSPLPDERMGKVDTAWLRMDSASNLMMINGVWTLTPGIPWPALCERVQERMLAYPRFRQCVVRDAIGARWVEDAHFDIRAHVVRTTLPRRAGEGKGQSQQTALQERIGELAMQPLDPLRPLWQFHLIDNFVDGDGQSGSALIMRIHHCIADGMALLHVILSLVDGGTVPPAPVPAARSDHSGGPGAAQDPPLTDFTAQALQALHEPQKTLAHARATTLETARLGQQLLSDMAALALMPNDSPTRLKGVPGGAKRVAWCTPLPLHEVKAVGAALGCSLNDVLLSCVAGALGSYLRRHGERTEGQEIRAMVPVNLRSPDEDGTLGNHFGLVPLLLPIGINNPIERVYEVRRRMAALKGSTQPLLTYALLAVAGVLVQPAQDALLGLFSRKTTAVMTNVPGPHAPLTLCGARLAQCLFWVPQSGSVGLGVSILSYAGNVQFGLIADTALCPEPQQIIDAFIPEFEQLLWLSLMLP